ncbi:MAG TPA: TorF family putative porin [Qipengyuania sp.]|nr:TorF family putative porin [Qipengyuania sp.]
MLTSFRGPFAAHLAAFLAAASLLAPSSALAQDAEEEATSPVTVTGSVGLVTDYRFRGVSLSGGDPAVQGGVTLTHDSGFYVGTWASSIDDGGTDIYGDVELDLFGGWSGNVAEGVGLDVGLLYYAYPTNAAGVEAEYFEPYATVSGTLGPVQAKLGVAYAWEQDSLGGSDNLYVFTKLSAGIPNTPITLNAGLGYTDGALAPPLLAGAPDDTGLDWTIGATATVLGNVSLGVAYTGVEGPSIDGFTDDAIVGSLTVSF